MKRYGTYKTFNFFQILKFEFYIFYYYILCWIGKCLVNIHQRYTFTDIIRTNKNDNIIRGYIFFNPIV